MGNNFLGLILDAEEVEEVTGKRSEDDSSASESDSETTEQLQGKGSLESPPNVQTPSN